MLTGRTQPFVFRYFFPIRLMAPYPGQFARKNTHTKRTTVVLRAPEVLSGRARGYLATGSSLDVPSYDYPCGWAYRLQLLRHQTRCTNLGPTPFDAVLMQTIGLMRCGPPACQSRPVGTTTIGRARSQANDLDWVVEQAPSPP